MWYPKLLYKACWFSSRVDVTKPFPQKETVSVVDDESKKDSQDSGFSEIRSTTTESETKKDASEKKTSGKQLGYVCKNSNMVDFSFSMH